MQIRIDGLTKQYPFCLALDAVSMEIDKGKIIALLGPNGAGKTTLLRCLSGMSIPEDGEMFFDDVPFERSNLAQRKRLHFMPDFPTLFGGGTIVRNISIMLRLYERDQPGQEARVIELLGEFDLLPYARAPMNTLSRGQAYKGSLVGLIAADPDLWLLDEPFASGMDSHGINAFKKHALEAAGRGRTILYSTQILDVAERFSDRACVISGGKVVAYDKVDDLRAKGDGKGNVLEQLFKDLRED
jgi:ABC-type multidrug transport system ATPase subunit